MDSEKTFAYVDTGSDASFATSQLVRQDKIVPLDKPVNFTLLDGTPLLVTGRILSNFSVAGETRDLGFFVFDIPCPALLGRDLLAIFPCY